MISRLSEKIARTLGKSGTIPVEEQELYGYGFFLILSNLIFLVMTMVFGAIFEVLWESIVFYIMFIALRGYAGGAHASKESTCFICTSTSLFFSTLMIRLMEEFRRPMISTGLLLVCAGIVLSLSPMDTAEKRLTVCERNHYKKCSCWMTVTIVVVTLAISALGFFHIMFISTTTFLLESILLLIGKGKNKVDSCMW